MFSKLAKAIRDVLKKSDWMKVPHPLAWHLNVLNRFEGVATQDQLFDAVLHLETSLVAAINRELTHYSRDAMIAGQPDRSTPIWARAHTLFQVYRLLAPHARKMADTGDAPTRTVARNIAVDLREGEGADVRAFLEEIANFALLSLLISARSEPGQRLVNGLAAGGARIQVQIRYRFNPASLLAFAADGRSICTARPDPLDPLATLRERTKPIIKGLAGGSVLGAPVWFDDAKHDASVLTGRTFQHQRIDEAISKLLQGSISFDHEATPFFTPVRIELLHELIHVLHNARGVNREGIRLPEGDRIWKDAEEYWTIAGGNLCENVFNALIGLPNRHGHGGLPLHALDPRSESAQASFRQCAGL